MSSKELVQNRKRPREDDTEEEHVYQIRTSNLKKLKKKFYENSHNRVVQNSLCANALFQVSEVREYMQSRDTHFTHTLDPKLCVSNQGLSGRCWMFAVLNVMRHELIRSLQLPYDFELSESYLSFYEKMEKSNYLLSQFMDKDTVDVNDLKVREHLDSGAQDGGFWVTCSNLIQKYGIIPKSCYEESVNSFDTEDMNRILDYKLREFTLQLVKEKDMSKRLKMKNKMMDQIYSILAKMLGTPPNPNEKFKWSFVLRMDLRDQLERENKRDENDGQFETYQIKQLVEVTPLEFYEKFIVNDLNDYLRISNDPRNKYHQYYKSNDEDQIVEGEKNGYYNTPINTMAQMCIKSLKNNTPVQFDCDVGQYINPEKELLDTNAFDYGLLFGMSFDKLSKKQRLEILESSAGHAMVLVGVDLDDNGKPQKWKIENSWGRTYGDPIKGPDDDSGYYTMSHEWFEKFVYNAVIHKDYVSKKFCKRYHESKTLCPTILPENDIMA